MRSPETWSYRPYNPPLRDYGGIYICRLAPSESAVRVEWLDAECESYTVSYRVRGSEDAFTTFDTKACFCDIENLTTDTDYEIKVTSGEKYSRTRLARIARPEGVVINYLHPDDNAYEFSGMALCSPAIIRHPDGYLLASMDVYGANMPQNLSLIFRSDDDGESWHYVSELFPCYWGNMFIHNGKLYMWATSTEYGDMLIGCSEDGGYTFSNPTVLLRGACNNRHAGIHKNPLPARIYGGRYWMTYEWGCWAYGWHAASVASFPLDADPCDASAWSFSEPRRFNPSWPGVPPQSHMAGGIEGNLVVLPDGKLYEIMRFYMAKGYGLVLCYRVNTDVPEAPLEFSHMIPFPGNCSKFCIQKDGEEGDYYAALSRITKEEENGDRRLLSIMRSKDALNWELVMDLIDYRHEEIEAVGFQYPYFLIEGDDIILLSRTAMNRAHNFHDANYTTFHRIKDFRSI